MIITLSLSCLRESKKILGRKNIPKKEAQDRLDNQINGIYLV